LQDEIDGQLFAILVVFDMVAGLSVFIYDILAVRPPTRQT
jgi:hypothetical protein